MFIIHNTKNQLINEKSKYKIIEGKYMNKYPLIGVSIIAVVLLILGSLTNVVGYQTVQSSNQKTINTYDDVDIDIHAGVYGRTNGNYGLGFVISITNNLDKNITGTITIYCNFTDDKTVRIQSASFFLSAYLPKIEFVEIDWHHFPYPILKLTVNAKVNETATSISRSGIEIGPFVFFSH
jgi:hypothetical protein